MASLNGFSISSSPSNIGVRSYRVPGTDVYLPVRSEIAPLLIGAAAEWHRTVEPLVKGWCWGYAYRPVTGGSTPSFHSPAIAIDLNAPRHPYGRRNTMSSGDMARVRAIARKYGLRWGGDYRTVGDEMHLEVIVSRTEALALVRRLQARVTDSGYKGLPVLREGASGSSVRKLQTELDAERGIACTVDGDFGAKTKAAVITFQKAERLTADGIVGAKTWGALL